MHGDEGMEFDGRDALDERIDAALRRYAEGPQFSETRVALARVRALAEEMPRRRWSVWAWVVPSAVVAALIGVVLVWVLRVPQTPQIAWVPKAPAVTAEQLSGPTQSGAKAPTPPKRLSARLKSCPDTDGCRKPESEMTVAAPRRLPKMEVFPTPEPLSTEERALLALATQAPPDVTRQVIEAQEHLGDPIQIAAITIRPLNEDDQQAARKGKEIR